MIVGDAANLLLGGIPGDLHDMFVMDVEPDDLISASHVLRNTSTSVHDIHVKLTGNVSSLEGRWEGSGAATFDSEIWQPLSHGLGTLERECATAAAKLASLAVQAEAAHAEKVEQLTQEIQTQLNIYAGTSLIGGPELGGVISDAVGALAGRLGGELVGRIVAGLVDAIATLLSKVLEAFGTLLKLAATPLRLALPEARAAINRIVEMLRPTADTSGLDPASEGLSLGSSQARAIYSGPLVSVAVDDPDATALAERIGGTPSVRFSNDPVGREFDAMSDQYIGQAKPKNFQLNQSFRAQAKATFEAASATGRDVYYHFNGPPAPSVVRKLNEYSQRYGVPIVIDTRPF